MPEAETGIQQQRKNVTLLSRLQQNRFLLIGLAIAIVLLLVLGVVHLLNLKKAAVEESSGEKENIADTPPAELVEVLPQNTRDTGKDAAVWYARDPFALPLKLTGVVTGGWGESMAIIEAGGTARIVKAGDVISEIWAVLQIYSDAVVLKAADREIKLQLHNAAIEEVFPEVEPEEEQEEGSDEESP